MSVQTQVLVHGRWTTRTLEIQQILARNREEKQEMVDQVPPEQGRPVLGIITRTLIRSPVIKSIIPARIRHRSRNDVVLVYDDAIVIKEVLGGERIGDDPFKDVTLEDVVEKRDFDSPIQAARILGLPREPKVPRFPGKFWSQHTNSHKSQSPSETKPEPLHDNEVPPQILVLTLASRSLLFLFAYHDVHEQAHFLSNMWPLPAQADDIQELGVHLAVDPKWVGFLVLEGSRRANDFRSRAMAVGAHEDRLAIYTLKSMEQIRKEVQRQDRLDAKCFSPIHEEQFIELDGAILKMEFLHPSKGDEHHVILLLVVSKGQRTLLVRFEWDCKAGLSMVERKPSQVLANSERLPLLLIPLTYGTSFALVCGHQITVYKDILAGNARGQTYQLTHNEPPEEPGSSERLPSWTQWARPMRPSKRREPDIDNVYLCRSDGVVRFIDIKETSHPTIPMISSTHDAGILKANLSSAFATLDLGPESNDVVIAAGEMSDGGMWYLKPRQPPEQVGTIRNWTPLRGITTAQICGPTSYRARTDNQVRQKPNILSARFSKSDRLFACSGRGPRHGAITEIRMGTEAVKLGPTIELGELADNGILDLWAMPDRSNIGIYLMVARPTETELILLPSSIDQDPQAASEVEELNLHERTIAAGSTAEGFLLQVTPSSINAMAQEYGILPLAWHPEEATITAASFLTIPNRTTVVLIVLRRRDEVYLHHGHFGSQAGRIVFKGLGDPVRLPSEASSVALHWVENRIIAFVGTLAATLQMYTAKAGSGLSPYFEYSFDEPSSICDSLAVIMTTTQAVEEVEDGQLVVCGLRNGTVRTLWFDGGTDGGSNRSEQNIFGTGGFPLKLCESLIFGSTAVKVMADTTRSSRAFVVCEQTVCTLEYLGGASPTNPTIINKLWLTDPNSQAFQQGPLTCVAQASSNIPLGYSKFAAGSLFYLRGNSLLLADVSSSPYPEMVPRRLPLIGTPTKMLYSERLGKLVVLYNTPEARYSGTPLRKGIAVRRKAPQPAIAFVRPDVELMRLDQDEDDHLNVLDANCVLPGEKLLGLMEWFPTDGKIQFHMLVVNTSIGQAGNQDIHRPSNWSQAVIGRLLFFSPGSDAVVDVKLRPKIDLEHKAEIRAVAPYGESSLVYGCGNDICFRFLDLEKKKFKQPMKLTLRSPAVQVSVQGVNIHVSTESHGHHIISVGADSLVPRWADTTARNSAYHLIAPDQSLVITTDLEGRIAGLWQPPQPQLNRTTPLIFEAFLHRPITKLCSIRRQKRQFPLNQLERQILHPHVNTKGYSWEERYIPQEAMLGTSEDGTVYQVSLVGEASWRLLAFIQNMAMREPEICPCPSPRVCDRDLEPSMTRKQDMHIDGDILIRFIERDSRTLLKKMLAVRDPRSRMLLNEMLVDGRTEDRSHRFRTLAAEVFKDDVPKHEETGESVLKWLRLLLMSAI
ncbi:MAG: hypothetical protein Q9221_001309 [Calogaya cf. arnoldii]